MPGWVKRLEAAPLCASLDVVARRGVVKLGVTGHQKRDGIDWAWVRTQIDRVVTTLPRPLTGYSSLAVGADQVFAYSILEHGASLVAVIPLSDYEAYFSSDGLNSYRSLLRNSRSVQMPTFEQNDEEAFFKAGLYVADQSDLVIAVWDEQEAKGHGGTGDIVRYCEGEEIPVIVINPIGKSVSPVRYEAAIASGFPKKQ